MSAQPESSERLFVLEKLSAARKVITKGCTELVTNRNDVEKHREGNLPRAQEYYLELQKTQKRILAALRDAQLALLETDDDALASTAGKLYEGLSGFNLMSRTYKPVCEVLNSFAQKLPESQDTVNAQVIGRLMNRVRMGYYPTDPDNIAHILRGIQFPEGVTTNVFDPCCGCGVNAKVKM